MQAYISISQCVCLGGELFTTALFYPSTWKFIVDETSFPFSFLLPLTANFTLTVYCCCFNHYPNLINTLSSISLPQAPPLQGERHLLLHFHSILSISITASIAGAPLQIHYLSWIREDRWLHHQALLPCQNNPQLSQGSSKSVVASPWQAFIVAQVILTFSPGCARVQFTKSSFYVLLFDCVLSDKSFRAGLLWRSSGLRQPGFKSPLCHLLGCLNLGKSFGFSLLQFPYL